MAATEWIASHLSSWLSRINLLFYSFKYSTDFEMETSLLFYTHATNTSVLIEGLQVVSENSKLFHPREFWGNTM